MSPKASPSRSSGASFVLPLYTVTLFLSAFLLFSVQPMFTKMVLPLLGGSAAVWNTAVVFFQATLLLGYFYAHLSTKLLGLRRQTLLHGAVLLVAFLALPMQVADWTPPTSGMQIPWLIGLLTVSIGLPFFAVSATAPLLQKWFAHTDHAAAGDPYFLYGGSNLGSLAALLSYPLLVEPTFGLSKQGVGWTIGYAALGAAIATCGATLWRRYRADEALAADPDQGLVANVTWRLRGRWLALSVVPSALLLGVTLHIGTDVASIPFLWVLPLALYLLTFVLVFARRQLLPKKWILWAQVFFVAGVAVFYETPALYLLLTLHIGAMFFSAWVCHGELARQRPVAAHLTEFYLWMSIGGVVGGFLAGIAAPMVFDGVYEYPIALLLALLLRPRESKEGVTVLRRALDFALPAALFLFLSRGWLQKGVEAVVGTSLVNGFDELASTKTAVLAMTTGVLLILISARPLRFSLGFLVVLLQLSPEVMGNPEHRLIRERSFFGVYSVNSLPSPRGLFHVLQNGTTNHGGQNMDRPLGPIFYYTREGPVGQFFEIAKQPPASVKRIGIIGLGVGSLASYLSPDQTMRYFEIDPLCEELARDPEYFSFLADAGEKVDVVIGDGRLAIADEEDGSFDAIVVDAFSSDAIPIHLLTREAIDLYFQKLSDRGFLLLHITNAYLSLMPIVGNLVHDAGLSARFSSNIFADGIVPLITFPGTDSDWVVVARKAEHLNRFAYTRSPWPALEPDPKFDVWTDDFSNVLQVLKWRDMSVVRE